MSHEFRRFDVDDASLVNGAAQDDWTPDHAVAGPNDGQRPASIVEQGPTDVMLCLVFAAGETAAQPVLAVLALARALREVRLAGWTQCSVYAPAKWRPSDTVAAQIARLAPGLHVEYRDSAPDPGFELIFQGEQLASDTDLTEAARTSLALRRAVKVNEIASANRWLTKDEARQLLREKSRELSANTAKPGDGIVTRYLNRPVSQALTRLLLHWFGPVHPNIATGGTAIIAAGMFACLLAIPGSAGLLLGALLFQAASMFDGVDGEIARATFRTSPLGASLDSLVDAATNILFFVGVIANLYNEGDQVTAAIALTALGGLVLGTVALGINARQQRGVIDFNSVKQLVASRRSRLMQALTWLTMRDFYAFAAAVLIGLGLVKLAVWAFFVVVSGWLVVVLPALVFRRRSKSLSSLVGQQLAGNTTAKSALR